MHPDHNTPIGGTLDQAYYLRGRLTVSSFQYHDETSRLIGLLLSGLTKLQKLKRAWPFQNYCIPTLKGETFRRKSKNEKSRGSGDCLLITSSALGKVIIPLKVLYWRFRTAGFALEEVEAIPLYDLRIWASTHGANDVLLYVLLYLVGN